MVHRAAFAALLAAVVAGCSSIDILGFGGDRSTVLTGEPIQTDSSVYHVRTTEYARELTVALTFANPTGRRVYIPTCHSPHPPILEKWENETWVIAYYPIVLACAGPPVVIDAGAQYRYTYHLVVPHGPNTYPRFEVAEVPGTYRLVWNALGTSSGEQLPLHHRVSNTFVIAE
jgi:hypothetical protein